MSDPLANVADYRGAARRRTPRFLFDHVDGGSYAEATLRRNVEDLAAVVLEQRVMRDVAVIDTGMSVLGQALAMPVILAPIGLAGLNARRGEVQAAAAAARAGVPFCLSTVSACPIEEVQASGAPFWFQLYTLKDRGVMAALIDRAAAAKCPVLVYTVDLPRPGKRYRDVRSGLTGAPGWRGDLRLLAQALARPGWAWDVGIRGRPLTLGNLRGLLDANAPLGDFLGWLARNFDPAATWDDLAWVRALAGPAAGQGRAASRRCRRRRRCRGRRHRRLQPRWPPARGCGVGGDALPGIVDRVRGSTAILADGGVRSGLDVLRLVRLGSQAVLIGRLWVWGLAARGGAGVDHVLALIRTELETAMALTGRPRLAERETA